MNRKSLTLLWWCFFLGIGIIFFIPLFGVNINRFMQNNSWTTSPHASWAAILSGQTTAKKYYYTSKNPEINEKRQLNAKFILEASQQGKFPLSSSQWLQWGEDLNEETIDRVADLIRKIDSMKKNQSYSYHSLEEYILLFAYADIFTGTGKKEEFDEKKICTLPLKDAESFVLIRDQFLSNVDYVDKQKEAINQTLKEQLSLNCKHLNIETQTGTLEDYVRLSYQNNTPLDPTEIQKYPMGVSATNYFVEKMYIFWSPIKQCAILINEWARRRMEDGGKSLLGEYKTIQAMSTPEWQSREYRMKVLLDQLITGSALLKNANSEAENGNPDLIPLVKKTLNLFKKLEFFKEADLNTYIKRGEEIDAECAALKNPTIRTCVGNKMVLSYLYLYEQQYEKAIALLKTAENFPLMRPEKVINGVPQKNARWDVYRATSLWAAQARAYFEKGDYATAQTYLLRDVKSRPLGRNNLELKMNTEALAGKFDVIFTFSK